MNKYAYGVLVYDKTSQDVGVMLRHFRIDMELSLFCEVWLLCGKLARTQTTLLLRI